MILELKRSLEHKDQGLMAVIFSTENLDHITFHRAGGIFYSFLVYFLYSLLVNGGWGLKTAVVQTFCKAFNWFLISYLLNISHCTYLYYNYC